MNVLAKERLDSAISKMIAFKPIYGTVFMYLHKVESLTIPTMAVGVVKRVNLALYYNPDFIMNLTHKELRAVLQHEALHVLLHHITRSQHFQYHPKGYNIAADLAINCHISDLPEGGLFPKNFGLPDNEAAEWYYKKLKQEMEEAGKKVGDAADGKGELVDDHSMWGDCEDDIVKEKIRGVADKAIKAQEARGWGSVPGGIAQAIIAANKPVINWKREIRWFINRLVLMGRRSTRMRPNRRYGYKNPGSKKDYTSKILVAIDTSGSISDRDLKDFATEINGMIEHVECHVIQFDTKLYGEPEHFDKKFRELEVKGRGGTSFDPVMTLAEERRYDGLIMLTDGYALIPPKPNLRVLWALTKNSADPNQFPYGKTVVIEGKKD